MTSWRFRLDVAEFRAIQLHNQTACFDLPNRSVDLEFGATLHRRPSRSAKSPSEIALFKNLDHAKLVRRFYRKSISSQSVVFILRLSLDFYHH